MKNGDDEGIIISMIIKVVVVIEGEKVEVIL